MSKTIKFKFDIGEHVYFLDGLQPISEGVIQEIYDEEVLVRECITKKLYNVADVFVGSSLKKIILDTLVGRF